MSLTWSISIFRHAFDEDRVPDLTEEIYLQDIHSISSLLNYYNVTNMKYIYNVTNMKYIYI